MKLLSFLSRNYRVFSARNVICIKIYCLYKCISLINVSCILAISHDITTQIKSSHRTNFNIAFLIFYPIKCYPDKHWVCDLLTRLVVERMKTKMPQNGSKGHSNPAFEEDFGIKWVQKLHLHAWYKNLISYAIKMYCDASELKNWFGEKSQFALVLVCFGFLMIKFKTWTQSCSFFTFRCSVKKKDGNNLELKDKSSKESQSVENYDPFAHRKVEHPTTWVYAAYWSAVQ